MRLLIMGAAGGTGREFVRQGVERGHTVTALAHHEPSSPLPSQAQLLVGDARDSFLLDRAVAGQDAVVDVIGTRRPFLKTTLETDAAAALVAAMHRHGVTRVAAISSLGVGDSVSNVNWIFRALMHSFFRGAMPDKEGMEQVFRDSGLDWLIVRPSGLTNRHLQGKVHPVEPASGEHALQITRADVAAWTLRELENNAPLHRVVGLTAT